MVAYEELLSGKVKISEDSNVAIIGAGGIGFDVASYLLHKHEQTSLDKNEGEEAIANFMKVIIYIYPLFCIYIYIYVEQQVFKVNIDLTSVHTSLFIYIRSGELI